MRPNEFAKPGDLYVSPQGSDKWSGREPVPNVDRTDGPLATIEGARRKVRAMKESGRLPGPITVWIREGRYAVTAPLTFTPEDSAPVTYAAFPREHPVIDGGRKIEGWKTEKLGGQAVWVAEIPEVAAGKWNFRQLFVNGSSRPRARLPKTGEFRIEEVPETRPAAQLFDGAWGFRFAEGDIRNWKNLGDVEIVVMHLWIEERMPIASLDEQARLVTSSRRSRFVLGRDPYYVENVFEALGEPGEWYLDWPAGKLYYVPMAGEDPQAAEVYAPVAEQLLRLVGDPECGRFVEFLRFEGLTFQHTRWQRPRCTLGRSEAGVEYASCAQAAYAVPGAICLEGARYCAVEDGTVRCVGGYAVEIADGCRGVRVVGNELHDLGAGGVKINGADADGPRPRQTGNNRVTDNHIHDAGRVFHSAVGILSRDAFGNTLSHNHIHDLFYSGISCGWVWGYRQNVSRDNRIENNHIHHLGHGLLSDMGGIYTLGVQPGTVIRGNLIHDLCKRVYGAWTIYLDEGSSHILVENNLGYNTNSECFHEHYGRENILRNNIFAFGDEGGMGFGRAEDHIAFTAERNIFLMDGRPIYVGGYAGQMEKRRFRSDLNLIWDVSGSEPVSGNGKRDEDGNLSVPEPLTLAQWHELGYDRHSVVADPCFKDAGSGDFTLSTDCPGLGLGFVPFDNRDAGLRHKDKRD